MKPSLSAHSNRTANQCLIPGGGSDTGSLYVGKYRKMHPPKSGVDNYVSRGNLAYPVFDTEWGKFGISICADEVHPEDYRIMTLSGVEVIAHPTALPLGIESSLDYINPTRAIENRIYVVCANRTGVERGTNYIGSSSIFGVDGKAIARAEASEEKMIYASLDLTRARQKQVVSRLGKEEGDILGDRRPEYYGKLIE